MHLLDHLLLLFTSSALSLAKPTELTEQMVSEHMGQGPEECDDFLNPSEECQKAVDVSMERDDDDDFVGIAGGKLKYSWYSGCESVNKKKLEQAAYDAYVLSSNAIEDSSSEELTPIWNTWMGPDHRDYKGRVIGNLGRAADFKQNKRYDIYISCNDPKKICKREIDGRPLLTGGYAWTYHSVFGYNYSYINLCDVFFGLDSLGQKVTDIGEKLDHGDASWAKQARFQTNMAQFFLHEMMHLNVTNDYGVEPHITDEYVNSDTGTKGKMAYGPPLVHLLARRRRNQGGGARRASTNADSYAWLANSVYFYDNFGEYPLPINYKPAPWDSASHFVPDDLSYEGPVMLHLGDFGGDEHVTEEAFEDIVEEALRGFLPEPESTDEDDETDPNQRFNSPNHPQCDKEDGDGILEDQANDVIDSLCDEIAMWENTLIVPPISIGAGATKDGRNKGLGVYNRGPKVEGTDDRIWSGVTFSEDTCTGNFMVATGETEKDIAECKSHLKTILSGCGSAGGTLKDSCQVWYLKLSKKDPGDEFWKDKGEVECDDVCTDDECREMLGDDLADACKCWYSNYDTVTAQFDRPDSGKCDADDVNLAYEFSA